VSPICFFELGSGKIISEADGWKKVMQVPGMENGFDIGMPKKFGEFLAMGSAYAPEGEPVASMDVSIGIRDLEKTLKVTGNREWKTNLMNKAFLSMPEPFTEMEISWSNAYGGEKHPDNKTGKGCQKKYKLLTGSLKSIPWPTIEDPKKPLKKPGKNYEPQSFGMFELTSKKRQKKAGTYNKKWLKYDHPGYPDDVDWSVFNAACERQWFNGFINGDETYEIKGMHPEKETITGTLPRIRTRIFINQNTGQDDSEIPHFQEIDNRLDTVWFFPAIETGILIFRGRTGINDSDALDVKSILLAYENMNDSKRSKDYYNDIHDKRFDIKTAAAHVFNESQLSPEKSETQKKQEADEKINAEKLALEKKQTAIDQGIKAFQETTGTTLPDSHEKPVAEPDPVGTIPEAALKRNDFDLSEILENVQKVADKHMEEGKKKLEEFQKELPEQPVEPENEKQTRLTGQALQKAVKRVGEEEKKVLLTLLNETGQSAGDLQNQLESAGKQMMEARRISPEALAPEEDYPASVSKALGDLIKEMITNGESLHERDVAGADVSNVDFSGLDMTGIMLEKANLSGCRFHKTNLTNAVLNGACLDNADFSGATMSGVNLCNTVGENSRFKGCDLTGAPFIKANLKGADFSSCILKNINGMNVSFIGSNLSDSQFEESLFIDAELDEVTFDNSLFQKTLFTNSTSEFASFKNAGMTKCALVNLEADGSDFSEARLKTVQFAGDCLLRSCDFTDIDARECGFRKSNFEDSCFNSGGIIKSDMGDVSLARTSIKHTVFSKSIMMGASIQDASIEKADFYEALLRKADFARTDLNHVSFYSTELSEAILPEQKRMKGIIK